MEKIMRLMAVGLVVHLALVPVAYAQSGPDPAILESDDTTEDTVFEVSSDTVSNITLELKGVDILDVLKVLSKKSGLNIVAGKNVRGQVTLFLQNVDVWDALKIVLETSDLAYEQKGDIVKVITKADYEALYGRPYADKKITELVHLKNAKAKAMSETLNQIKSTIGRLIIDEATNSLILIDTPEAIQAMKHAIAEIDVPMQTRVFPLKYATAEDLETKLSEIVTENVGSIRVDSRTNKIVVTDIPAKLDQIATIINTFDEKPRQVLIEAKLVEVVLEDEYVLGIDWNLVLNRTEVSPSSYTANTQGGITIPASSGPLDSISSTDLPMFTINSSGEQFNAVISALEGMGKTNTLSNPRLLVLNNEEASLAVATRQPFVSQTVVQGDNTSTTADNVEFVDVGVTLNVTPTITQDDHILMAVKPEVSTAGTPLTLESTDVNGESYTRTVVPIVTSQEVETKVIVRSGTTLIIGGLIQDAQSVEVKKVPLLGDIPLIGAAFRNKSDDFKKTELVIFITPYIISPDDGTDQISRFVDEEGRALPFNKMGGKLFEFSDSSDDSQPYLGVNEKPFWEKNLETITPAYQGDKKKYIRSKALEQENVIAELQNDTKKETNRTAPEKVAVAEPTPAHSSLPTPEPVEKNDATYFDIVQRVIFDALSNDVALRSLSGEVFIHLVINRNGFIGSIDVDVRGQGSSDSDVILAINRQAPFPAFLPDMKGNTVEYEFSLHF